MASLKLVMLDVRHLALFPDYDPKKHALIPIQGNKSRRLIQKEFYLIGSEAI